MDKLVDVLNLSKVFGSIAAVDDISFQVNRGDVLGFLGPNGAGKSTTMKMLSCFLYPTAGTAEICGYDIKEQSIDVKRNIGFLAEGFPVYGDVTPFDFLNYIAEIRGFKGKEKIKRVDRAIELSAIGDVVNQQVDTLSKGFKRRVGFAQSILHDPEVLFLDEPTDGLDPNQKFYMRKLIREMSANKAIVVSTHILGEVDAICNKMAIIDKGKIKVQGSVSDVRLQHLNGKNIVIILDDAKSEDGLKKILAEFERDIKHKEKNISAEGKVIYTILSDKSEMLFRDIQPLVFALDKKIDMCLDRVSLDKIFRDVTLNEGDIK